jgi:hypothetical protein
MLHNAELASHLRSELVLDEVSWGRASRRCIGLFMTDSAAGDTTTTDLTQGHCGANTLTERPNTYQDHQGATKTKIFSKNILAPNGPY